MRNDSLPLSNPGGLGIFAVMARALTPAPFQPDFRARWDMREPAMPAIPATAATPAPVQAPPTTGRTAALPGRGLMDRLERWFWSQRQRDVEAYLAQSTDIHDLEARIRGLERNSIHPYY